MPEHNPGQMGGTMRLGKRRTIFRSKNSVMSEYPHRAGDDARRVSPSDVRPISSRREAVRERGLRGREAQAQIRGRERGRQSGTSDLPVIGPNSALKLGRRP